MRKVITRRHTFKDAMGERSGILVTVPKAEITRDFERIRAEIAEQSRNFPKAAIAKPGISKEAYRQASEKIDPNAGFLSDAAFMNDAKRYFDEAAAAFGTTMDNLDELQLKVLDAAFKAGMSFKASRMRSRHLLDVEREEKQKKARSVGGETRSQNQTAKNMKLFRFMVERIEGPRKFKVKAAVRLATKAGLGAQSGDIEKDTEANRQRYIAWVKKGKNH